MVMRDWTGNVAVAVVVLPQVSVAVRLTLNPAAGQPAAEGLVQFTVMSPRSRASAAHGSTPAGFVKHVQQARLPTLLGMRWRKTFGWIGAHGLSNTVGRAGKGLRLLGLVSYSVGTVSRPADWHSAQCDFGSGHCAGQRLVLAPCVTTALARG